MRLFVAVFPDEAVNAAVDAALERALRRSASAGRWRPVARDRRHVTLRFHADADPGAVAADLRRGLDERALSTGGEAPRDPGVPDDHAPRLHCVGAGVFGTALWLGVRPDDGPAWSRLLCAAGTEPADHVAHLTVARCRGPAPPIPPGLDEYRGPWWRPDAVALVASGVPYRVLERFGPVGPPGADEAVGGHR